LADPTDHTAATDWQEVTEPSQEPEENGSALRAVPGLVRIAATAGWRTAEWTVGASFEATSRVLRAAASGESAAELFERTGAELQGYLRGLLGILDGGPGEGPTGPPEAPPETDAASNGVVASLRERGAELLRRAADLHDEEDAHPAYRNILENLAPDEARILRLLSLEGPQPSVDVRTSRPFGLASELIAPGLTMIAGAAGCRQLENTHAYLNNLYRLGLIWFSREQVGDHLRYQVLEAQPDVQEAMSEAGRGRTVRRSIHLTPFGQDFCQTCIPVDTAEFEAIRAEAIRD
jgi:Abortive infection alpha